jgi:ABC-2 type transport system ATP-binding protein
MSIQPQKAAVFPFQTIAELLAVWASFYPAPDTVDRMVDRLGLTESRDVRIAKLSGGQQQRVLVGLALIGRPELVVLDEPSTGMDPNARHELWAVLREYRAQGGTVLISTHAMEEAEQLCDRVAILDHGTIMALGEPAELIRQHSPGRAVGFTLTGDGGLGDLSDLATVVEHRAVGDATRVSVVTEDSDAVLRLLTARVGARDIEIHDAGLDGVFSTLTGRGLDDTPVTASTTTTADLEIAK